MGDRSVIEVRKLKLGEGKPKICVPLTGRTPEELFRQTEEICECPHDLLEWRADYYQGKLEELPGLLVRLRKRLGEERPLIFTFRTREEGGEREISLEQYEKLNLEAAKSGCADLIDLEYNRGEERIRSLIRQVKEAKALALCSCHDFLKTPSAEEMTKLLAKMHKLGGDVVKLAVMPQKETDVLALMEASLTWKNTSKRGPFITMSMSPLGVLTRLAGSFTGSAVTFAAAGEASAPGQISAWDMPGALSLFSGKET